LTGKDMWFLRIYASRMGRYNNKHGDWESSKIGIPSGKLKFYYGKSPFLMGKSTINGHFQ
jgi:hypothetical protein